MNKKFIKTFAAMLAVFFIPFVMVFAAVFALPAVYDDTFVGELSEKYDRLCSIESKKIVIVGGSSAAFGLDSRMIEDELGYEVVNFGLYADLGTKLMMDLSRASVNEGDIFILAPEMSAQTLSLYFGSETALEAMDGRFSMLAHVDRDDYGSIVGAAWKVGSSKLRYLIGGERPVNQGAYKKENFNEYGDNVFDRPYNELSGYGNPIRLDFLSDFEDGDISEYEEFIEYVNEYTAFIRERGGEVYFSFPPMNEKAVFDSNTDESIRSFYKNLCLNLNCKVISNVFDYIMDDGYFFDSEFHLNNSGVTVRTVRLIDDIKRELGRSDITLAISELPSPSGHRPKDEQDMNQAEQENIYFLLEAAEDGSWKVVGLTDEGKALKELTIPDFTDGAAVSTVSKGAFEGSSCLKLTLGVNISRLDGGALSGSQITEIIIPDGRSAEDISVPNNTSEELFVAGGQQRLAIYVDSELYEEYIGDYFWGDYAPWLQSKAKK